jgi:hypothetical protein
VCLFEVKLPEDDLKKIEACRTQTRLIECDNIFVILLHLLVSTIKSIAVWCENDMKHGLQCTRKLRPFETLNFVVYIIYSNP